MYSPKDYYPVVSGYLTVTRWTRPSGPYQEQCVLMGGISLAASEKTLRPGKTTIS